MSEIQEKGCVIIPGYNEDAHIRDVVERVRRHCPNVVVVDDGSSDRTAEEAAAGGANVLRHQTNKGKGVALATGFAYAQSQEFEFVITMDADGQHDPEDLPRFLKAYANTQLPVLVGDRMTGVKDMPLVRKLTNRYMSWLLSRRMKQEVPDTQNGYRLYRCDVISKTNVASGGFAAESEILLDLAEAGVRIGSVTVKTIYGDEKSKIHPVRDTIRFFRMLRRRERALSGALARATKNEEEPPRD